MGNSKEKVMWHEVYRELAELLVKVNPEEFYQRCIGDNEFIENHKWAKKLEGARNISKRSGEEYKIKSFDPIQIFASFNGLGMKSISRIEKINIYFRLLSQEKNYQNIDFSGCPTLMLITLVAARNPETIEEIWKNFNSLIEKGDKTEIDFNEIKDNWYGISTESFTIFLFWIDSKNFLPLDKNTLALFEANNKEIKYSNWDEYKEKLKYKDSDIYQVIVRVSLNSTCELIEYAEELKEFGITKCLNKSLKIIAIKPLGGCNKKFLKGLKEGQLYLFDKAYSIGEDGRIEYDKENDIQLFNQSDLQVNINAIVGRNGTGKSTLIELLLAVIHNIGNTSKKSNCKEFNRIDSLNVELIFEDLNIYKIIVNDNNIKIEQYNEEEKKWKGKNTKRNNLFYNILVNYSIHSLDSSENSWIEPHFNNDCHTEIMIEPFRENGNINIQEEEKRVKQRLIVNLLESTDNMEDEYNHRQLTHNFEAKKFIAKLKKGKKRTEIFKQIYKEEYDEKTRTAEYSINDLSGRIAEVKKEDEAIDKYILDNYIDDIILENDIKFSQLSSGEKQKIYSINSILYHIREIDRKKKHKHINLILDEIELYFHPELQRTYISDIIKAIKKVGTENILGINITFITHSPFILSDIPKSKILFLEKDSDGLTVPKNIDGNTFGANIHILLSGSFFMENGLMGEFAKEKINTIIQKLKDEKYIPNKQEKRQIYLTIESIGEPFLKSKMLDMYHRKFTKDYKDREKAKITEQIILLNSKLKELDND